MGKTCNTVRELKEKVAHHYGKEPYQLRLYLPKHRKVGMHRPPQLALMKRGPVVDDEQLGRLIYMLDQAAVARSKIRIGHAHARIGARPGAGLKILDALPKDVCLC
jgi:hypothetical protein